MMMMMMLGAVLLGVAAACVVVLVSMGMTGSHLSRNHVLFFSGAIFITLAVCVHLTPSFSSVSDYVTSVSTVAVFDRRSPCLNLVNRISWAVTPNASLINFNATQNLSSSFGYYEKHWDWPKTQKVKACRIRKFSKPDASRFLNGSWVVIAGDSQARFFTLSLLNLILGSEPQRMDSVRAALFKRHSNYSISVNEIGMKLDFVWAPYVLNLTHLMMDFKAKKSYPGVMVMGAGLWHMLHLNNASDYESVLRTLKGSLVSLFPFSTELAFKSPHLFWLGFPVLINGLLNTHDKRQQMSDAVWHAYDAALSQSRLLRQTGGPLDLLDIPSLTWNCGAHCTYDGMHYDIAIYEAALQIMLNFIIKSSHRH
ncbi:ALTERED XYLOGLUCAN 9 [Hibiscus trionum]|uniref:ALTERED XYLOGLUCAN 9 n=1 Tax=Hibiscus trionum TaxID=183268 RepID=A0A9W7LII9_HIBTR|nr:ALTERED XYLOGLUCAN 9 [Hibiscus trionum]